MKNKSTKNTATETAPLTWDSKYSVREKFLDTHHQSLLALVNLLRTMCQEELKVDEVLAVVSDLRKYCNYHFVAEEKYMAQNSYPGLENHAEAHEHYDQTIAAFSQKIEAGELEKTIELVDFLEHWWEHHILTIDQDYADFIEARA